MKSSEMSRLSSPLPLKSKKPLHSSSKTQVADQDRLATETPQKPAQLRPRSRNRNIAFSIKQIRGAAQNHREANLRQEEMKSSKRKIDFCPTETPESKLKSSVVDSRKKLPEKYEILGEFFDSLSNAIRLLRLKGRASNFTNICSGMECLTDRRFSYGHLAQLKFIFPEALEIKKILILDEATSCMKPDLHISISSDALENDGKLKTGSGHMHLRKSFRKRLTGFIKSHPMSDEVPQAILPEPFNDSIQELYPKPTYSTATHVPQSFKRRFSLKVTSNESANTDQSLLFKSSALSDPEPSLHTISFQGGTCSETPSKPTSIINKSYDLCASPACTFLATSKVKGISSNEDDLLTKDSDIQFTPAKLASTPARLMVSTPSMLPPSKKTFMSPDPVSPPTKLVRRSTLLPYSLKFDTPKKNEITLDEVDETSSSSVTEEVLDILPQSTLQSIMEKEQKFNEEKDPAISQAKRRLQMKADLPKLFDSVHFLFRSINRTIITKVELMHKIISGCLYFDDRREVEEQLSLLVELAPGWISEKSASSGDLLLCINKSTSPELIRARLEEEAKRV